MLQLKALALSAAATSLPVPLIIDTDMSFDVDDVLAVCVAHALADRGEARLLAMVHNTGLDTGGESAAARRRGREPGRRVEDARIERLHAHLLLHAWARDALPLLPCW